MAEERGTTKRPLVLVAMVLAMFMAAIEGTIVATAMPSIAAKLGGFSLYSWVFSSFLLMQAVTVPIFGKLADLYGRGVLSPLMCVSIHAGTGRKMEYGTAGRPDYQGWGMKADAYTLFIFQELLPAIRERYRTLSFREKAFAGFSLGALSAMDIVWHHPQEFSRAGLFSGSFWWRTRDKNDPAYQEATDRIMHEAVRKGGYYPWLKFFFECGTEDEMEDRNHNGVIDSIDDTQDLIGALTAKGWDRQRDIRYLEIAGGKHNVETWARAMPEFLLWGWGKQKK